MNEVIIGLSFNTVNGKYYCNELNDKKEANCQFQFQYRKR